MQLNPNIKKASRSEAFEMRNRRETKGQKNREMNKETYGLRREVMAIVYEAKSLVPTLPRINVRITDGEDKRILGVATMKGSTTIWIPAHTLACKNGLALRHVVLHEICHAAFGSEHDDSCPLMAPVISKTTRSQQNAAFKRQYERTRSKNAF